MQLTTGFIENDPVERLPSGSGPLDGLVFASKDIFELKGHITSLGQPQWRATHAPATTDAPVITSLLDAGAHLIGKTHTDELCYSIAGQNSHNGTPPNPALPGAIPGGSSSGSVSVTAAGLVDFAIGSDTGGSVRIPASYCGVYGIRPTHGAVSTEAAAPLAPRFDTLGWFARDIETLGKVGKVLLPEDTQAFSFSRVRGIADVHSNVEPILLTQLQELLDANTQLTQIDALTLGELDRFPSLFRVVQGYEAWQAYGEWIEATRPNFGPGIRERFEAASKITADEYATALAAANALRDQVRARFDSSTLWCMPTAPSHAPAIDASPEEVDAIRSRTMRMNAIAGIAGLPQISLPLLHDGTGPVGLSLIGPAGSDRALLNLAAELDADWNNHK
ncbi:amidase [Marinobacterium sp. YM272]|uniref:amidase n=1 Tax=Marinobacterium sp. YM272 TaxID=3421654 RepID=UPI003D7F342E